MRLDERGLDGVLGIVVGAEVRVDGAEILGGFAFDEALGWEAVDEAQPPNIETVRPDGTAGSTIDLSRDTVLNLRNLFVNAFDRNVSIESVRLVLRADGEHTSALTLKVHLRIRMASSPFVVSISILWPRLQRQSLSPYLSSPGLSTPQP